MQPVRIVLALTLVAGLGACGTHPGERAITGARFGAAGALTSPRDAYLGRRAWERY